MKPAPEIKPIKGEFCPVCSQITTVPSGFPYRFARYNTPQIHPEEYDEKPHKDLSECVKMLVGRVFELEEELKQTKEDIFTLENPGWMD